MLQSHKHCLAPRYCEHEFTVATEHSAASTRVGCKRATKGVDVLYQYRVAVHPMGNLELDLAKSQKTA